MRVLTKLSIEIGYSCICSLQNSFQLHTKAFTCPSPLWDSLTTDFMQFIAKILCIHACLVYITDRRNSVFDVSTMAPSVMDGTTTIECRFSNPLSSPNSTRQCQLCYSTLINSQTPSECITQSTNNDDGRLVMFRIPLPSSSGGEYGPFFYTLTAIEDNVTLAVAQGQQYTGKL